ncbi:MULTISPECIES: carbohydrate-binding protein [unclassified Fibrobacter]|uniref:carbohydrate-binding protein n=1 Tax=unclassified Fibrobacter TaxID=2634177 RepID=UPI000D6BAB4B|nr:MULTISPECIES: cellulase family glycosylhydrolase [unclassified Fibrobacter]PWJ61496.1 carbohydrate binding protein with CBM6 domain [Fibrobacter sp. UWR4]PZW67312.1 carbohydrate binding protein with CBM6 domain [Fibrobacter sp. UWR1]
MGMLKSFKGSVSAVAVAAFIAGFATQSFAVTNQFRGTNWADKRDNFVSDVLKLSGMTGTEDYQAAYALSDRVMSQFVEKLGINSLRIPINEPTALKAWSSYKGIIDGILAHGRMLIGYWGPAQPAGPKNMDDWWKMWDTVVKEYGSNPDAYFEIFNEPHMYSKTELRDLYAKWLARYPDLPRDHVLLDGSGLAWNVPDIADDSRFDGCLFAVHEYTFWNMSITTEQGWMNSFKGKVGKYADRTVATEWGGAMGPGDKNGVHYEIMDYNDPNPTNYFMAYIRGMSEQLRQWKMGSFYWVGLRDGDWYSMVTRSGEGANTTLNIVNQSGVDRMQYSWTDTVEVKPVPQEPFGGYDASGAAVAGKAWAIPGKIEAEDFDIPGVGNGNDSYKDSDKENHGDSDYRKDTGVDLYKKPNDRVIVGYNAEGEWLEYTVNVAENGDYTMFAAVASANNTSSFKLSMDGKDITDTIKVPQATAGEDNYDDYNKVSANVTLEAGEHVLRFTVTGSWMDIDYINFVKGKDGKDDAPIEGKEEVDPVPVGPCDDCDAIGQTLELNRDIVQNYRVFSMSGKLLGMVRGNAFELAARTRQLVKTDGIFIAKPAKGAATIVNLK